MFELVELLLSRRQTATAVTLNAKGGSSDWRVFLFLGMLLR
jgi:hypothetical protein